MFYRLYGLDQEDTYYLGLDLEDQYQGLKDQYCLGLDPVDQLSIWGLSRRSVLSGVGLDQYFQDITVHVLVGYRG